MPDKAFPYRFLAICFLMLFALASACGDDEAVSDAGGQAGDGDGDGDGDAGDGDGDGDAGDGDGDGGTTVGNVEPNPDGVDPLPLLPADVTLPIIFVHGYAGSAQQYESQAQRFIANGYPAERIRAYDHDGAGLAFAEYVAGVDEVVDQALEDFDVEQVYLVGHSRGTAVSTMYLGNAERAAKVAKYIALDGSPCPAAVDCIAPNQAGIPGQAHVEIATSPESFEMQYEFLVGDAPTVVDIVPQKEPITLSGRAVNFPANTGRADTTLNIYELDGESGHRASETPYATFEIGEDGNFGPVTVDYRKFYEFALTAEDGGNTHHIYLQRYLRDSQFVRLLSGASDSATRINTNTSDDHTSLIAIRMREWYATDDPDLPGDESDVLEIGVESESGDVDPTNVMQIFMGNATIGVHIHDNAATPLESDFMPLPYFQGQPFQTGVDFFMPAADPPDGTITLTNMPRGDTSQAQTLHVPNWQSSSHAITVQFSDFPQ